MDNGERIRECMDIEKGRGISVGGCRRCIMWNGVKWNMIESGGEMDFIGEVEGRLKMVDGGVVMLWGKEGIEGERKLVLSSLEKVEMGRIIFMNKIEGGGVNLEGLYMDIKRNVWEDVVFMESVVDGLVYGIWWERYIKEE